MYDSQRSLPDLAHKGLATARERNPVACSSAKMALLYLGAHALWAHRVAYRLWRKGYRFTACALSQTIHNSTGIEIHPAVKIDERFFIDHGMDVIVGETAGVGDDVLLFHGMILDGVSMNPGKCHPTVGNNVQIDAGAKVPGPVTVEDRAKVGANAVLTKNLPQGHVVVDVPSWVRDSRTDSGLMMDPTIYI